MFNDGVFCATDSNEDEWEDVDDSSSLDSADEEAEVEAAQDVDMVRLSFYIDYSGFSASS